MVYKNYIIPIISFSLLVTTCKPKVPGAKSFSQPTEQFKQRWYTGNAEINSYDLTQARYGELRKGEAILLFVTEDFSTSKLVKLDEPDKTNDKVRVMKTNFTKKFFTGIYPYSMMVSAFTPVSSDGKQQTIKADCSAQEWCGHTFSQLQLHGDKYDWQLHSYFEKEGAQQLKIKATLLEDELWNRIRLNPNTLPEGNIKLIPGLMWQRLSHTPIREEDAITTVVKNLDSNRHSSTYKIEYPALKRTINIHFNNVFPNEIIGWDETYPDGFVDNKKMLTTTASLKKSIWLPYWKHNANADSLYRDSLQLLRYE